MKKLYKKARETSRVKKYVLQDVGADLYKKLQNIEIQVKDITFWKPKGKYRQIKRMIEEYEQSQEEIKAPQIKEREAQLYKTLCWLRDKKRKQCEDQTKQNNENYIFTLLYFHLQYLKKLNIGNLRKVYNDIKRSFYKQNVR
jgi:hypothetical protein